MKRLDQLLSVLIGAPAVGPVSHFRSMKLQVMAAVLAATLSSAFAQVNQLGPRQSGDVALGEQKPTADKGNSYHWSLCQGESFDPKKDKNWNKECGGPFNPSKAVTGGNPPYHFQLDTMGGFPPFGIHLDPLTGNLTGKLSKGAHGSKFRVCAVDLIGSSACQPMTIDAPGADTPGKKSHTLRNVAIAGGTAAAVGGTLAAVAPKNGGGSSCSSLENTCINLVNQCLNQHANCSQVNAACTQSCQCQGFSSFNVGTGSCQ